LVGQDTTMPTVQFTPQLRRFVDTPEIQSLAATLRAALEDAFAPNPRLRGYVLDDQARCARMWWPSSTANAAWSVCT
jgi:hypothetical protein